jgi:hypothetical protein
MFKEEIDDYPLEDDAFDDTYVSTMPTRAMRLIKQSSSENRISPLLKKASYSSLFSLLETDSAESPKTIGSRFSSTSSAHSGRHGSISSLSSLGVPSTPGSIQEFVIPKRTTPPRPHTLTSRGEVLSHIEKNNMKGYHSVILKEMKGAVLPKNHLERPVCRGISTLDFDSLSPEVAAPVADSLSGFEF